MFNIDLLRIEASNYIENEYNGSLSDENRKILIIEYIKEKSDEYFNNY